MSDGTESEPLELRQLFEQFHVETQSAMTPQTILRALALQS